MRWLFRIFRRRRKRKLTDLDKWKIISIHIKAHKDWLERHGRGYLDDDTPMPPMWPPL